jgi:hypothetical protein
LLSDPWRREADLNRRAMQGERRGNAVLNTCIALPIQRDARGFKLRVERFQ